MAASHVLSVLLVLGLLAGCLAGPVEHADESAPTPTKSADAAVIELIGKKVLASTPGRRASEFWVERDPNDPMRLALGRLDFLQLQNYSPNGWTCFISTSTDGGRTWRDTPKQPFPGPSGDPWVAFAPDGTLHAVCNTGNYVRTTDNGTTWIRPPRVATPGNDRPSILVDAGGRLLYCATRPGTNEGPSIVYSDDGGDTWTRSEFAFVEGTWEDTICNHMAQGPDGTLYVAIGISKFRLFASHDRGHTWTKGARIEMQDPRRANYGSSVPTHKEGNMFPSFDVSPTSGAVFAAVLNHSQTTHGGIGGYHVELYRSRDQGASYEKLAWPKDASACRNCDRTRGVVHVDDEGRLGALWRTADLSMPVETWFSVSLDEGETWLPAVRLSQEEMTEGWWAPGSFDGADHYWSMQSSPEGFVTFWIDRAEGGLSSLWSQVVAVKARPTA